MRDASGSVVEHLAAAAGLDDDDRDRVGDNVVELTRDSRALLRHGDSGSFVLVALELDRAEGERALTLPSEPDRQPGPPRAADDQRGEDDVAPVERIAVVGYECGDRKRDQHCGAPGLTSARVRSERVQRDDEDDHEDHGLVVESRRQVDDREDGEPDDDVGREWIDAPERERNRGEQRQQGEERTMRAVAREPDLDLHRHGAEHGERQVGVVTDEAERAHASNRTPVGA